MKEIGDLKLFDVQDLAKKLDLNIQTVRRFLKEGRIKGKKVGKKWFVTEEHLRKYFEVE